MRSLLYLLLVCVTLWVPTNVHGACSYHDYQTRVLDSADALERVPGICPGTEARGLISGTTQTGPFAFLGTSFPDSDFNYTKPFCLAVTASTDPSNTGPLFAIQSGGANPMMSNLTITRSGITFNWGGNVTATFPGAQYADGNFQQFQLCVSAANRLTLYTGPDCTEATSVPFNQAGPDFSNGLISVFQPITGNNYNGRVQQFYVTQCSEVSDEQKIANVQCANLPANCNQPPQSLTSLLSSLQASQACPVGTYAIELADEKTSCLTCPGQSFSPRPGCRECTCIRGYYRTVTEGPSFPCTSPPTSCGNLQVVNDRTRATTITIRWNRPEITGRDDFYYNIFYSENNQTFVQHNPQRYIKKDFEVDYSLSGLKPLTKYLIKVVVENGVSDQLLDVSEENRKCEVFTGETGDTRSAPPSFVLGLCSNVVWKAPRRTYGRIIGYDIRFVRDNQTLTFTKAKDEFFHLVKPKDFPDDNDTFVQVRAKTSAADGLWTELIPLGCSMLCGDFCTPQPCVVVTSEPSTECS